MLDGLETVKGRGKLLDRGASLRNERTTKGTPRGTGPPVREARSASDPLEARPSTSHTCAAVGCCLNTARSITKRGAVLARLIASVEVGSLSSCVATQSSSEGVYDLSGNVWEWEDSCDEYVNDHDFCYFRSGSFNSGRDLLGCAVHMWAERGDYGYDAGLRCCSP